MTCPRCSHEIDEQGNCVFCDYTPTMEEITMNSKVVFIVESHGDPSVGISGYTAKVTIDDSLGYDEEDIQAMKKMISDHYDEPVANVYTQAEWNAFLKAEHEMYKQMAEEQKNADEDQRLSANHIEHCSGCALCEG